MESSVLIWGITVMLGVLAFKMGMNVAETTDSYYHKGF